MRGSIFDNVNRRPSIRGRQCVCQYLWMLLCMQEFCESWRALLFLRNLIAEVVVIQELFMVTWSYNRTTLTWPPTSKENVHCAI